jgi:integration host factor subunit alpha
MISGFGKWSVKQKNPRIGRNPHTGEQIIIDARRVVTFKSAEKLRSTVNGSS